MTATSTELTTRARERTLRQRRSRGFHVLLTTLGGTALALAISSIIIFFALHYLPGDQAAIIGGVDASPAQLAAIRAEHGWDRPVIAQYLDWIGGALTGDFGASALTGKSVTSELALKLQVTIPLAIYSLVLATILAFVIGVFAARKAHTWIGRLVSWVTQLGIAVPAFVVGLALVALVAIPTGWFPATGFPRGRWADPGQAIISLTLPAITLAIPQAAILIRYVRSALLEQIGQDHMRTALAQGMSERRAFYTQALRNASLPIMSVIALDAATLIMGTVIVEQVFALPGVGYHLLTSVSNRDIVMVQGFLMVLTTCVIVLMMVTNLLASLLDPRVRVR